MTRMRASQFAYFDATTPIGLAHRGGAAYGPNTGLENTVDAFRNAVALGYRYLETDVHATADGELVAFHDPRLDRVTDAVGAIKDLPLARVREATVGASGRVPLLIELLEEFPQARFNIDIKDDAALAPTVATIRRTGAIDRVCVGSFSQRRLWGVRRALGEHLATSAGLYGVGALRFLPGALSRLVSTPAPALQVPHTHTVRGRLVTVPTRRFVDAAHMLGKHVHVWFHTWEEDTAETMHGLLDLGVDGIVTDRIEVLRDVLAERGTPL